MNRLVRDHYPLAKLPEDLREGFEGRMDVRVTIDVVEAGEDQTESSAMSLEALRALFRKGRPIFSTTEEISDHLRALREEWD